MTNTILPEFVCAQSHRWRIDAEPADRPVGEEPRCPVCGGSPVAADPPLSGDGGDGPSVPSLSTGFAEGATQFGEGATLTDYLNGAPLPVVSAAEVVETLARAVHEAHRQGFSHGSLATARVVLEPTDPPRFVDPGLGRLCEQNGRELIPRVTGFARVGAAGTPSSSIRVDVLGLGSILYELLTGTPVARDEIHRGAASPCARNHNVPRDLGAICLARLEPDPDRQLADAGLVAGALRQFLETFVTQFPCSRCSRPINSKKPLRIETTVVRFPHCG
jgi:hypothetical protein